MDSPMHLFRLNLKSLSIEISFDGLFVENFTDFSVHKLSYSIGYGDSKCM